MSSSDALRSELRELLSVPAAPRLWARFNVGNLDTYTSGALIRSSSVTRGHFRFRLLVFPKGTSTTNGLSLSAFIEADASASLIPEWSFPDVRVCITLVNHKDSSQNVTKMHTHTFKKDSIDSGWHDMAKISDLTNARKGWLGPTKSLLICGTAICDMSKESWLTMLNPECKAQACLASNLSSLLSSGWRSDAALQVDGREIKVHSLILAARSPVFKQMLDSGMEESNTHIVSITDVSWDVLNHLCGFMYSGVVDDSAWENDATLSALMRAAAKYQVLSLLDICAEKAEELLVADTAADWLVLSAQLNVEQLKDHCAAFVAKHLADVQATSGWERLMQDKQMVFELAPLLFRTISPPAKKPRLEAS